MDRAIAVVKKDADGLFQSGVYASMADRFRVEPQEFDRGGFRFALKGSKLKVTQFAGGEAAKVVLVGVPCPMPEPVLPKAEGEEAAPDDSPGFFDLIDPVPVPLPSHDLLVQSQWANGRRKVVLLAGDVQAFQTTVARRLAGVTAVDGHVIYLEDGPALPIVADFVRLL